MALPTSSRAKTLSRKKVDFIFEYN